jgi:hypothetical protein
MPPLIGQIIKSGRRVHEAFYASIVAIPDLRFRMNLGFNLGFNLGYNLGFSLYGDDLNIILSICIIIWISPLCTVCPFSISSDSSLTSGPRPPKFSEADSKLDVEPR